MESQAKIKSFQFTEFQKAVCQAIMNGQSVVICQARQHGKVALQREFEKRFGNGSVVRVNCNPADPLRGATDFRSSSFYELTLGDLQKIKSEMPADDFAKEYQCHFVDFIKPGERI